MGHKKIPIYNNLSNLIIDHNFPEIAVKDVLINFSITEIKHFQESSGPLELEVPPQYWERIQDSDYELEDVIGAVVNLGALSNPGVDFGNLQIAEYKVDFYKKKEEASES